VGNNPGATIQIHKCGASTQTLDNMSPRSLVKIFCTCGKIVDLGKREMNIKLSLKKELECTVCRNARISKDIDMLNDHFDGKNSDEENVCI
jgi:hypothetical protein